MTKRLAAVMKGQPAQSASKIDENQLEQYQLIEEGVPNREG